MLPINEYLKNPSIIGIALLRKWGWWLSDKTYTKLMFRAQMGYKLNLKNPQTFSEKIQWLKLYNRKPEYTIMVDKYAVKDYVAKIIGDKYVIPTLGVWERPEDIDWDALPYQFVLKTTHGGGNTGVVICKDKTAFDRQKAIEKLNKSLKQDIYRILREWPYKDVPRRIIAEKYIDPAPNVEDFTEYRWYCFAGKPKFCQVIQDRHSHEAIVFFDTEWNHQELVGFRPSAIEPIKPKNLEMQIRIAQELSKDIPISRIDLYETDENSYFGKITCYPASGFSVSHPDQYNEILGQMINMQGEKKTNVIIKVLRKGELIFEQLDLVDYKFFCFDGKVRALFIGSERGSGDVKFDYFDADFNHLDLVQSHPMSGKTFAKPKNFELMKALASKLSKGLPHVRVDLYNKEGKIYFGELTFYHHGGITPFHPSKWDYTFGEWITLPEKFNK